MRNILKCKINILTLTKMNILTLKTLKRFIILYAKCINNPWNEWMIESWQFLVRYSSLSGMACRNRTNWDRLNPEELWQRLQDSSRNLPANLQYC